MDDSKWEKYAALGGVAFVVLNIIGAALAGQPPAPDDSDEKIVEWFTDHTGGIQASQFLGLLSVIALLWWFGSLWRKMTDAEGGRHRLSIVAALGLVFSGSLFLAANGILSAVALRIDDIGSGAGVFYTLSSVLLSSSAAGIVTFLAAVSVLGLRTRFLPQWIGYLGLLAALLFLVGGIGSASDSGAIMIFGFIGWIGWSVWTLAVSFELWKRPASALSEISVTAVVVTVD
ncbi:MAG: hypothetical protein ABI658_00200 [Acidimicrobiales bacterium]